MVSPDSPKIGTVFEEGSEGLMASEEGSGTGSAGELMDLMRRLLRLREGACVAFEDRNGFASIESWRVGLKRVLVEGLGGGGGDDDAVMAVGIK